MRYCLRCRRLSGDGRLCTSCRASFGGRLCDHPSTPHLNPATARSCGWCPSTNLYEPAGFIPLSWIGTVLKATVLLGLAWLAAPPLLGWIGGMLGVTQYRDWRVWAFETFVPLLLPLLVVLAIVSYVVGLLLGRRAGRRLLARGINLVFDVLGGLVKIIVKLILRLLDRNGRNGRNGTGV